MLKWSGTVLLVLILGMFISSLWWDYGYYQHDGGAYVACAAGQLTYCRFGGYGAVQDGWYYGRQSFTSFLSSHHLPTFDKRVLPDGAWFWAIYIPLWLPFAVVALPTVWLWRTDRRHLIPPGHCHTCGYNLTGNVSGVCPECGTAVTARTVAAANEKA